MTGFDLFRQTNLQTRTEEVAGIVLPYHEDAILVATIFGFAAVGHDLGRHGAAKPGWINVL